MAWLVGESNQVKARGSGPCFEDEDIIRRGKGRAL